MTPCQIAACRAIDGLPISDELWETSNFLSKDYPAELRPDKPVQALFGGVRPQVRKDGSPPRQVLFLAGTRAGKSLIASSAASRMALTVHCGKMAKTERARVSLLSVARDNLDALEEHLTAIWMSPTALNRCFGGATTKAGFVVNRPDGYTTTITPVAGAAAGKSLISRWMAGVVFDEAARMTSRGEGKVNINDAVAAVRSRLLPWAQILEISSPWAPQGYVYNQVKEHWGKSHRSLLIMRGTGPMLNPVEWTPEKCWDMRANAPLEYLVDCRAEFVQSELGLFSKDAIERNLRATPERLPYRPLHATYVAGHDPSSGSGGANGFALVVVEIPKDRKQRIRVAAAQEWRGMDLRAIVSEAGALIKSYGLVTTYSDRWAAGPMTALAADRGFRMLPEGLTADQNARRYADASAVLSGDDIELAPVPQLCDDLLSVTMKPNPAGGWKIELPHTADGRHADYAPAWVSAVHHATRVTAARVDWGQAIQGMQKTRMLG